MSPLSPGSFALPPHQNLLFKASDSLFNLRRLEDSSSQGTFLNKTSKYLQNPPFPENTPIIKI
jgi:hypothetical protein